MSCTIFLEAEDAHLLRTADVPEGVRVMEIPGGRSEGALPHAAQEIVAFVVNWGAPIAQGMVSSWLYDVIRKARAGAKVNGGELKPSSEDLRSQIDRALDNKDK